MKVELTNTAKKLCVIGDPVLHSKSPLIQNAVIEEFGLDYIYLCQPVPRGQAGRWLDCAAFSGYAGFNATIPHKEALVPLMDAVDEFGTRAGAVNTVCIQNGKYYGFNTDCGGVLRALGDMNVQPCGKRVLLLGAGGAARGVAVALTSAGAEVVVCNRSQERAEELCALDPKRMTVGSWESDELCKLARGCQVVVNCTSLGMIGIGADFENLDFISALPAGAAVLDAVYAPAETSLLRAARAAGHPAENGMGMLLHQAILALEHFTGQSLDPKRAMQAALKAVGERIC